MLFSFRQHTVLLKAALLGVFLLGAPLIVRAETRLERGAYLVEIVGACGNCHSPVDQNGKRDGPALSGGPALLSPVFVAYASNITPDPKTGIGTWSEQQIVDAMRDGKTPDGHMLRPPMPVSLYRSMSDEDAYAIAVYLKSLPPIERETPKSIYKAPMPASYGPPVGSVAEPPHDDAVAYGAYLAKLGHCMECHTPIGPGGKRDLANRLGAGGFPVALAWGKRISANITPDPETGLGTWSNEEIVAALSRGVRNDGTTLSPIMPWPYWQSMKPEDLKAIVLWLRTLRPVTNMVAR